ncbi:MAG: hypothetical protein NPIRA04_19700 [Nitrospirales bacterium]|nr:MAG: hypothetical protein NPIRA04_19700 [Nitrospirales bacterium]
MQPNTQLDNIHGITLGSRPKFTIELPFAYTHNDVKQKLRDNRATYLPFRIDTHIAIAMGTKLKPPANQQRLEQNRFSKNPYAAKIYHYG